jgi:hypothetical protein
LGTNDQEFPMQFKTIKTMKGFLPHTSSSANANDLRTNMIDLLKQRTGRNERMIAIGLATIMAALTAIAMSPA